MLLDKFVLVKSRYNYNIDYYESLGYDVTQEEFLIKIEHLLENSFTKVNVSCDYCGYLDNIAYYKYNRSMNSPIKKYSCKCCKGEKIKESNLLKYGVTSVAKLESSKEKSKKTSLEKWGVENHLISEEIKNKIKKTNLEKWGVENPMQSELVREKQKKTLFDLYGVDNISKLEEIKNKKKETTLLNYGVNHPLKSEEIKNKVKDTNLKKWGNKYFTKTEIYRKENYDIANDEFYLNYINNGISLFNCDYGSNHNFEITKDVYSKRKLYNVGLCTICNPIGENKSIKEKDLYNFIKGLYKGDILQNYRDSRMEIDIYLPELNLGFEFNGLYWHSDIYKQKDFHLKKTNYFLEKDIRIIHIWEDDWDNKNEIIKSQIRNLIGVSKWRIFARNCQIKEINDNVVIKDFLDKNHIQGYVNSDVKIGLYYSDQLVSIMTFDKFEGRKRMKESEWNLNRFCNKLDYNIIGGASKLFKYFLNKYKPSRLISYADKNWSQGGLYYKLGFKLVNNSNPDYKYIVKGKRVHKSRFRKSKTNISESKLNIPKIWDCGKLKFEF